MIGESSWYRQSEIKVYNPASLSIHNRLQQNELICDKKHLLKTLKQYYQSK